jgi:hypothetical protein
MWPARGWRRPAGAPLPLRLQRQEFQEQRHVVGQLVAHHLQAMALVLFHQVHHGLTAVARFAVDMLEQVQRVRRAAVERHILLLQVDQVPLAQMGQQRRQRACRSAPRQRLELRAAAVPLRIQQQVESSWKPCVRLVHRFLFLAPFFRHLHEDGRLLLLAEQAGIADAAEQPLPKLKPQLPFSLKLSSTISLWLDGITKRSS